MMAGPPREGHRESLKLTELRRAARLLPLSEVSELLDRLPVALLATLRAGRVAHNVAERMGLGRADRLIVQARAALRGRRNAGGAASSDRAGMGRGAWGGV